MNIPTPDCMYQICTRCVMDTTDPLIQFNSAGQCNHCTHFIDVRSKYQYNAEKSERELQALIAKIKQAGRGKKYDVILGLSGGIDSSYAAYVAKNLGLRILAVHMDNGWNAEEAVLNIKNIAKKLDIDYETEVLNWNEFKDIQLAFLKAGVPEAETPTDMAIPAVFHKMATKYGVKYIISGGNMATEGILPKHWHYNAKDMTYFKAIISKFGTQKVRKFPTFGFQKEMYYKIARGIKIIYLLNYIPYDKEQAMDLLKDKLDWQYYGGKHYESKYTGFIQSYYLFKKFGIDYRRATLSTQICNGVITRDEAVAQLERKPYDSEKILRDKQYIAKKLGISVEVLDQIIDGPAHWYTDYQNSEAFLGKVYDIYRKLFKKEKLANF